MLGHLRSVLMSKRLDIAESYFYRLHKTELLPGKFHRSHFTGGSLYSQATTTHDAFASCFIRVSRSTASNNVVINIWKRKEKCSMHVTLTHALWKQSIDFLEGGAIKGKQALHSNNVFMLLFVSSGV